MIKEAGSKQQSNAVTQKQKTTKPKKRRYVGSYILRGLVIAAGVICAAVFVLLVGYILIRGIPNIKPELFAWRYNSENVSMMPAIINTLFITVLALLFAVPCGVFSAIYLTEYAKRGNKFVSVIRTTAQTLTGIPSIVYGLFGNIFFVKYLKWDNSMLAGALTLAIMILPVVMRTTEEALIAVPDALREGSFGLGAGRLRTIFKIVLPSAAPGILSGVILGTGRVVGETAALIFTAGTATEIATSLFTSGRTLAVHMHMLLNEGLYIKQAYATAVVLLVLVIIINAFSSFVSKKLGKSDK